MSSVRGDTLVEPGCVKAEPKHQGSAVVSRGVLLSQHRV